MQVIKRDGQVVDFHKVKIIDAIHKAMIETMGFCDVPVSSKIVDRIERNMSKKKPIHVEEIQDMVEKGLMNSKYKEVAKKYILYRQKRTEIRENQSQLMKLYEDILAADNRDLIQENANVDGDSPMGQMGKIGYESAKIFATNKLASDELRRAIKDNYVHPHDWDFMMTGTTTCCHIPLAKLLKRGFNTGHGFIRSPKSILSAASLAAIILQANQNQQHGGQSFATFDHDLAPYVNITYHKWIKFFESLPLQEGSDIEALAWERTRRDTYQAMEAFVHNMNSMNSRSAGQVPFTSINYGTNTSKEGQLVIESVLTATEAGLGNGETPIFPIQIFKVKNGINGLPEDPNYHLFELACDVTSKRLFPNFAFIDAPFNLKYYDPDNWHTEVAYMGCRTRVLANVNGEETPVGRGNASFTSLNLVKMALESNQDISKFFELLEKYTDIAIRQLYDRYQFQIKKRMKNFKFLMGQGVWIDSDNLKPNDTLEEVLKHSTLSLGFIGLAEALVAIIGAHHGESREAWDLGYRIISRLRTKLDNATKDYGLNYTLLATPAESLSGRFIKKDRAEYGTILGVTDREYYTNSFHIPVYYNIKAVDKIALEAPFHELCNAGHITYVELDGNARQNVEAIKHLVKAMQKANIGYGSINHPVDRCPLCGFSGIIGTQCPGCQAQEQDGVQFERIRRITGYLTGSLERWNSAKQAEEKDRVKHAVADS